MQQNIVLYPFLKSDRVRDRDSNRTDSDVIREKYNASKIVTKSWKLSRLTTTTTTMQILYIRLHFGGCITCKCSL